jgi:hypothetical protein
MRPITRVVPMLLLLTGCVVTVPTNPDNYKVDPKATAHLRSQGSVALVNGFPDASILRVKLQSNTFVFDRRQLTETAIAMLTRALEKQGIAVDPESPKKITLRVAPQGMTFQMFRYTGRVMLQARFGDGKEAHIPQESLSPKGWENAFDGAVLFALNDLLEHEYFVAYVNEPVK